MLSVALQLQKEFLLGLSGYHLNGSHGEGSRDECISAFYHLQDVTGPQRDDGSPRTHWFCLQVDGLVLLRWAIATLGLTGWFCISGIITGICRIAVDTWRTCLKSSTGNLVYVSKPSLAIDTSPALFDERLIGFRGNCCRKFKLDIVLR
ncbi:hypothetical protein AKJ16_DCAP07358 [Drosera capensis]